MEQGTDNRKSNLFMAMSNEIHSALDSITVVNNLLLETELTSEQRGYVERAGASAGALLSLVNDLVDFSFIEAGEWKADDIEFDLRTAVEEAMETVAYRAIEWGNEVHTLIHSSAPETVRGDPARIRQIIVNLAGIALDISGSGEVVLTVRTAEESPERAVVRFDITEFGIDLSAEQVQELFEPFSRPQSVSTWKYGRTGLGLALSKRLAQLMGGQIGFTAVAEKGLNFWFSIELKKCLSKVQPIAASAPSLEGMNVLIADPSPSGRRIIVHYLEAMGCRCREFEHCEDILMDLAYSAAPPVKYDAVIIAMQQIDESGSKLVDRIKKDARISDVPLVMVTAIGKRGDARKMRDIGVAAYLTRPLKQQQLIDCMRMIRRESAAAAAAEAAPVQYQRPLITRHTIAEEAAGGKLRILIADDNAINRRSIKKYLDREGYTCDVAENGIDAIESLGRKEYDFVFMDCQMPIMNGYEAAIVIRKKEAADGGRRVPICGMIAGDSQAERKRCADAGMDDCLVKPFKQADVVAKVQAWERKRKAVDDSGARVN